MDVEQKAIKALNIVKHSDRIGVDVETSGVDWKHNFVVGWVINDAETSVYVPIRHGGGGNIPGGYAPSEPDEERVKAPHTFERVLSVAMLNRPNQLRIGHNVKFDCHFALNHGVVLGRNLSCTQNNQTLINEYTKSFSLDAVSKYWQVEAKKGEEMYAHLSQKFGCAPDQKSMKNFWRLPGNDPVAVDYAEGDGISTWQVYDKQLEAISEQRLERVKELEDALIWVLVRLERRGFAVDADYLRSLKGRAEREIDACRANLPDGFNPRSPAHVRDYIAQFRTDWPLTDKGNPSFPEKYLETFSEGLNVLMPRKWQNMVSKFVDPILNEHMFNGVVHANFNQNRADDGGTISGRLSCSFPNLQAFPKHDKKVARPVRAAFVARSGMLISEGDYSQIEPRLYAHYSQDPTLVKGYTSNPPMDAHTMAATLMNKDRNTTAKRMNMGMFTGMFPKGFAVHMNLSEAEATNLWNEWHETFPLIRRFQNSAKSRLLKRGYVMTLMGRKGRLEHPKWAYRAASKIIQGTNADIIKYKMVEIDQWLESIGDPAWLLGSIHDSILWETPNNEEGKHISDTIVAYMEDMGDPFNLTVPIPVDVGAGRNWAVASFGEEQ